jgi:hypothetical protein
VTPAEVRLGDLCGVVRSKNAKPFRLTLDVIFEDPETFARVRDAGVLTPETVAGAYGLPTSAVTSHFVFEEGLAFKFTIRRPRVQGSLGESDMYGAQQHVPLLTIRIPALEEATGLATRSRHGAPSVREA